MTDTRNDPPSLNDCDETSPASPRYVIPFPPVLAEVGPPVVTITRKDMHLTVLVGDLLVGQYDATTLGQMGLYALECAVRAVAAALGATIKYEV